MFAVTWAVSADAHHPGPSSVTPRSRAALEAGAGEFDLGRPGTFWVGSLKLEQAFFRRVSVGASIPVAHARYADGERVIGPTDIDAYVRGLLYAEEHGIYAFGASLGVELPTGDEDSGLGSGHVMLSPEILAHFRPLGPMMVHVMVRGHFSASKSDHHHDDSGHHGEDLGSVIAPHAPHEMYFGTAVGGFWEHFYVLGGVAIGLLPDEPALGPIPLTAEVGVLEADEVRVSFGMEVPVAGPERLKWVARLGVEYLF